MKKPVYFVPVDFTQRSYNALQYAMELAKVSQGDIRLFHVIDMNKLAESDNPLVVDRSLGRIKIHGEKSILSLCEIISESGINVTYDTVIGNIDREITNQVNACCPDLIIMGKKNYTEEAKVGKRIAYMADHTTIPLLVIPDSTSPKLPSKIALMEEKKTKNTTGRIPFFELNGKITEVLSIYDFGQENFADGNSDQATNAAISGVKNKIMLKKIIDFYCCNKVEMLCATKQKKNVFNGIFQKSFTNALVKSMDVPLLLVDNSCGDILGIIKKVILEKKSKLITNN